MNGDLSFASARVQWNNNTLILENSALRRVIDLSDGYCRTVEFTVNGTEFAAPEETLCDCSFFGINMPGRKNTATIWHLAGKISAEIITDAPFDAPHIEVKVVFKEDYQQAEFTRIYRLYSELPALSVQNTLISGSIPNCYWTYRQELSAANDRFPDSYLESCVDSFRCADGCRAVSSVEFKGRTDYCNELVIRHSAKDCNGKFNGNLLLISPGDSRKAQAALLCLQEAPPSAERRDFEKYDFRCEDQRIYSCCWGVAPGELLCNRMVKSYRTSWIALQNEAGLSRQLHTFLAGRFPMKEYEAAILVNPWGCGKFPELTGEKFLLDEIAASGEIGAEIYQIDDSWQKGKGLNELTGNNLAVTMDFWQVDRDRLPEGFAPLARAAKEAGVKLGLWCAPSYTGSFRDHKEFARMLLELHRHYGFATVKIDGVRIQTLQAQENLEALLHEVREKSGKNIFFNLDTTNGQRPGYFYFLEYGNIFLENRYCYLPGEISYHPEKTLRNLWQLSAYVRPQSLQIEVPSPSDIRNPAADAPDPAEYPFDYWCAIAVFANMLIWTAPSQLPPEYRETVQKMIALHRTLRREIFGGVISPIGSEPDGKSFTGFTADSGYALIFREKNCPQESFDLPFADGEVIAGNGTVNGRKLTMPGASWCVIKA